MNGDGSGIGFMKNSELKEANSHEWHQCSSMVLMLRDL